MFSEKELEASIQELQKLEDEIARIDSLYDKTIKMIPNQFLDDDGSRVKRDERLERIINGTKDIAKDM